MSPSVMLPFSEVREAWEDYIIQHGEHPTTQQLADQLGLSKGHVGDTLADLRKSGQCVISGDEASARRRRNAASRAAIAARGCIRCGCRPDERTKGCPACSNRHQKRRKSGNPAITLVSAVCKGCQCPLDDRTEGCKVCVRRHIRRRYSAKKAAPARLAEAA